jgi:hypothetical protein
MASLAEALTSTNFDPRFTLENIFPAYEIEFIDGFYSISSRLFRC